MLNKSSRRNPKIWISISSFFLISTFVVSACSNSNTFVPQIPTQEEYKKLLQIKEIELNQRNKQQNGIYLDAKQKAEQPDNVLMYNISWVSVFHKYGSILHLLSVLQNNPNQEIYIYTHPEHGLTQQMLKPIIDKNYANLHIKDIPWREFSSFDYDSYQILADVKQVKSENKKIDFYIDDYRLLEPIRNYSNLVKKNKNLTTANKKIFNNFRFLGFCRSINMFSDGSNSWNFWNDQAYNLLNACEMVYDYQLRTYPKSNKILKEMQTSQDDQLSFSDDKYSGGLLLQSLVTSNYKDDSGIQVNKYFLPGTDTILDLNSFGNMNSNEMKYQVFDPYYSLDAKLIDAYSFLNDESKDLFHTIFNVTPQSKEFMNGKINVIYSGRNIADHGDDVLTAEAKRIINLYKVNGGLTNQNVQVVFKGHPRDTDDYETKIKNKITKLDSSLNPESWLKFLNRKIPMEYYVFDGFLTSDETHNRQVIYYSGLSTIFYFLQAAGLDKDVKNVIVSDADMKNILKWNGYPSRVFRDQIILTEAQLDAN